MPSTKRSVPLITSRQAAAEMALTAVQADEQIANLDAECKAELDAVRSSYADRLAELRKAVKTATEAVERWAAGDLPNWSGRRLVFDNQIQVEFSIDPPHVVPTPQQRRDKSIIAGILGLNESGNTAEWRSIVAAVEPLAVTPAEHGRLRRRYLAVAWSLDRPRIQALYSDALSPVILLERDREILTALGLGIQQGESFRIKRSEPQPTETTR